MVRSAAKALLLLSGGDSVSGSSMLLTMCTTVVTFDDDSAGTLRTANWGFTSIGRQIVPLIWSTTLGWLLSLELTVTPLGRESGSVLDNIQRWRGQLGLPAVTEQELPKIVEELKVADTTAQFVDMIGMASHYSPNRECLHRLMPQTHRGDASH